MGRKSLHGYYCPPALACQQECRHSPRVDWRPTAHPRSVLARLRVRPLHSLRSSQQWFLATGPKVHPVARIYHSESLPGSSKSAQLRVHRHRRMRRRPPVPPHLGSPSLSAPLNRSVFRQAGEVYSSESTRLRSRPVGTRREWSQNRTHDETSSDIGPTSDVDSRKRASSRRCTMCGNFFRHSMGALGFLSSSNFILTERKKPEKGSKRW